MPGTSDELGRLENYFRDMLRRWESCNCPAKASAVQWRDRVVQQRQQASLPEALAREPLPLEQHIAAAAEGLRNEIAKMTNRTARKFARALCVPRGKKSTTRDELQKLQETTATLADEAKKAALNLADYRFQSRLTVFAYWCCDRRQRERKASLMSRHRGRRWPMSHRDHSRRGGNATTAKLANETAATPTLQAHRRRLHEPVP